MALTSSFEIFHVIQTLMKGNIGFLQCESETWITFHLSADNFFELLLINFWLFPSQNLFVFSFMWCPCIWLLSLQGSPIIRPYPGRVCYMHCYTSRLQFLPWSFVSLVLENFIHLGEEEVLKSWLTWETSSLCWLLRASISTTLIVAQLPIIFLGLQESTRLFSSILFASNSSLRSIIYMPLKLMS